jgi:hypothetical protein
LEPCLAGEPLKRGAHDHALEPHPRGTIVAQQGLGWRVDQDRGRRVGRTPAHRHEGVGQPLRPVRVLVRHGREPVGDPVQTLLDHRHLGGRQAGEELAHRSLVGVPDVYRTSALGLLGLLPRPPDLEIAPPAYRGGGDLSGPAEQPSLGLGRGEPAELEHLVDPDLAPLERARDPREGSKRVPGTDPALGLPPGDAVSHRDVVAHAHGAGVGPDRALVGASDELEHPTLRAADLGVRPVDLVDELFARGRGPHDPKYRTCVRDRQ